MSKDIKFKLTSETKLNAWGVKLFRIEATVDITERGVKRGEKGGWVESTHLNNGNARVSGNAWVSGNAEVYGNAWVYDDAWVSGNAEVYGNARVYGDAEVYGDAWVYGDAEVSGNARVYGNAEVYGASLNAKKAFTSGQFVGRSDGTPKTLTVLHEEACDYWDNTYVLGDYKIEDIKPDYETIEIDGKKYRKSDVEERLKELKSLQMNRKEAAKKHDN